MTVFTVFLSCHDNKLTDLYSILYYDVYFSDTNVGFLQSTIEKNGSYKYVFDFNDRGRGPHLEEIIHLNSSGFIEKLLSDPDKSIEVLPGGTAKILL